MVGRLPVHQLNNTFALAPSITIITVIKSKGNSYSKSGIDKCYRCGEPGHRSNEYPKMKQANIADYRDEGEGVMIEEASDSDFAQEPEFSFHNDIKSFIQDIRSRTRYALSSLTMEAARTSFLEHL